MSFFAADSDASTHFGMQHPDPLLDAALAMAEQQAIGILWLDADLRIISVAGALPEGLMIGAPVSDSLIPLIGLDAEMLELKSKAAVAPLRLANTAVVSNDGSPSRRCNIVIFWNKSRQRFLVLLSHIFMQATPTVELDHEIRRRRLIEQDLAAKSQEYARINQQLEEFAYVISHDLNAPLRALRYLSSDIQNAIDASSETGALDLELVRKTAGDISTQTRRMSKMLTDLLEYARIGRVQEAVVPVDTHALICEIVTSILPTTKLELVVAGDWPTFDTAAAPLDLVLRNLLENAAKHHDKAFGRVVASAETRDRYVVFSIADDGRGIDPEWQSAIFEPFRKIDDAHHPESSGIGLALVKKTIVTLGGMIEVRSDPEVQRGTTFIVSWPLKLSCAESCPGT